MRRQPYRPLQAPIDRNAMPCPRPRYRIGVLVDAIDLLGKDLAPIAFSSTDGKQGVAALKRGDGSTKNSDRGTGGPSYITQLGNLGGSGIRMIMIMYMI